MILSGRDVEWYIKSGSLGITPIVPEQFQQNGVDFILEDVEGHPAEFGHCSFVLGVTRETIVMPNDLMAFVELRSSWARRGIMLPPTIIDAGFKGQITLEICSFATALKVPYGERFAHLIFAKLTNPSTPYEGKYQGQTGITAALPDKPEPRKAE